MGGGPRFLPHYIMGPGQAGHAIAMDRIIPGHQWWGWAGHTWGTLHWGTLGAHSARVEINERDSGTQ